MIMILRKKHRYTWYNMHDVSRGSGPTDELFHIVWNFHTKWNQTPFFLSSLLKRANIDIA